MLYPPSVLASTIESRVRALELRVGRLRIAVPVAVISRVLAMQYTPLPLANQLVAGLGFEDARLIVCVSLTPARPAADTSTAVLFANPGRIGFGLLVEEALNLIDVVNIERGSPRTGLPRWVMRARTSDERTLGWIDAEDLIRELSAREVRT